MLPVNTKLPAPALVNAPAPPSTPAKVLLPEAISVDQGPPMFSVVPAAPSSAPKVAAVFTVSEPDLMFRPLADAVPWNVRLLSVTAPVSAKPLRVAWSKLIVVPCGTNTLVTLLLSGTTPVMPGLPVTAQLAGLNHSPALLPIQVTESRTVMLPVNAEGGVNE